MLARDTVPDMRDRSLFYVATSYTAGRVLLVAASTPVRYVDTDSYQTVSFTGNAMRPWLVPLIQTWFNDRTVMLGQAAFSAACFLALAVAIAATINSAQVRLGVLVVVLAVGFNPRVAGNDVAMLSESISLSLTALMIASLIWLRWITARNGWAFVVLFVAWLFARDSHVFLAVMFAPVVVVVAWRQQRRLVAAAVVAAFVWAWAAGANDSTIEGINVASHMAYTFDDDADAIDWFAARGMPLVPAFNEPDPAVRLTELWGDPTFSRWARDDGVGLYVRYAATHPTFAIEPLRYVLDGNYAGESMVDSWVAGPGWPGVWPLRAGTFTVALLAVAFGFAVLERERLSGRGDVPMLMLVSTVPHAFLVWHGSGMELGRHAVELQLVLMVSACWLIAVCADVRSVAPTGDRHLASTSAAPTRAHR